MNKPLVIGISLIALVGFYFYNQARTLGYLNYYVKTVDLSFDNNTPVLRLGLGIQNPSKQSFTVNAIVGNLYADGSLIGNVSAYGPIEIPPANEVLFPLNIRMSLTGIASDIVRIFSGGGVSKTVEFTGTVNVNNITSPIEFKYTIG